MIISTSSIKINVEYFPSPEKEPAFVFLLHGFAGSSEDWLEIIPRLPKKFSYAAVDLIGHGKSDAPLNVNHYKASSMVEQLDEIFNQFTKNKFILLGYSMGGRAALSYAVKYPDKILGLILESTSAGIVDDKLRQERVRADEKIIKMIEEKSLEEFTEYWMNQDIFASLKKLPQEKVEKSQKSKVKNSKVGLINSLRGFGTGVMPSLQEQLNSIKCKTLIITGQLDKKFTQINYELVKSFPTAKHGVMKNAGHNVHFEKPGEYGRVLAEFWEKLK